MRALAITHLAAVAFVAVGCSEPGTRTELVLGVATDLTAPDIIDEVNLTVTNVSTDGELEASWTITGLSDMPDNLPGSFGIVADDPNATLDIVVTGMKGNAIVVSRHAKLGLVEGKTLFYRLGLTAGCVGRNDCPGDTTCVEGSCRPAEIDPQQLPDYTDESPTTVSCESFTQFRDTATHQPLAPTSDAAACPPDLCIEGTCLKPPPPNPSGVRDVTVLAIDTNTVKGQSSFVPETAAEIGAIEAILPDGTKIPGTIANGVITIAGVPEGPFYAHVGRNYFYTTSDTIDLGSALFAATDHTQWSTTPTIDLNISGLATWTSGDELAAFSLGASAIWNRIDLDAGGNEILSNGATSVSNLDFQHTKSAQPYLITTSDDFEVVQRSIATLPGNPGVQYAAATRAASTTPFMEMNGAISSVIAALQPLTMDQTLSLDFTAAEWASAIGDDGSQAALFGPKAVRVSGVTGPVVNVQQLVGGTAYGPAAPAIRLLALNTQGDLKITSLPLADIPVTGQPSGDIVTVSDSWNVPVVLPGGSPVAFSASIVSQLRLEASTGPNLPLVSPLLSPTIAATSFFDDATGIGTTPRIAWQVPTTGRASVRAIAIYSLGVVSTNTTATYVGSVLTTGSEIVIPPGILSAGTSYVFVLSADNVPNGNAPFRKAFPYGSATFVSGVIVP